MREARAGIEFQSQDACWLQVHLKSLHINPSSVFSASTLPPADKKTSLKHPTVFSILITTLHGEDWRMVDACGDAGLPDQIGPSHPLGPFGKVIVFEFHI